MVDALGGHTAAQNTLGAEGLRDGDALSSTTLSNLLQGLRGNGIVRLQDTAYGSTRNAVNTQPGAVTRASSHTLTVQGGYAVLDGVLYEFAGGPGGTATVTIGTHGTGTALAAATEQSMYSVYIASQGGQAKIHVDGGSPVNTTTGLYPQLPTQFLIDYDTGGSILNDQIVVLATLRCSYSGGGGSHKVDVQEVNDKRIFTRSNPIYMTPLSSGTIVTDGSELSQISRGATEGINTAAQLNALFSGNEAGSLGTNANGSVKIDVGALWMSTGRSGASIGYGPGDGIDRGSNRMMDDLFFAGQENSEVGVVTKRLFTEGVAAPTGTLSTASYTISSHGDKWFIFAPANSATITLNPEKSGSTYLFPEGHVVEVCNSAAANGGNIVFDSTGLNTTLLPDQRATFIYEGSTWLRCDYQAAISTLAFTTLTDTPSSLGTAGQHIRVNSGGNALEFIDSPTLTTEAVQDIIGDMVSGNTETNIAVTYVDGGVGVGKLNFVVAEQRTDAQVNDLAGALFTGNTETFITATYQTSDDTVDLVVPVHDEDNMSSDSATHLATQQSIKAYVDTSVAGVIDSAPGALDTLNELAAAINDDASFHTTVTTALTNRVRVDTASQGLTNTQKSNARTNMGLGTVSTLSAIDISSNTNLSASSPLTLTGDTLSIDDIPFSSLHADAVQISSESFADNDTTLMTSASIQDKILSYGYSTTTGTVTSVATGTGLTGGAITGSGTLSLSHLGLESLSDPNADKILFWDDSAGTLLWLLPGSNLSISGTTLAATNTNQLTTFTIRDDDDDAKTIEQGKFIKFVSATGTAGTNWAGAGTTGDPFVMTITNPDTQLTGAQVKDFAGAMFTGNTETFITATYQTGDDTVDLVVPVHDEDNMASNSATHLATQQSIKAYVDTEVSGLIDSAPGALDTLNELAAAINDDASFHTTMTTALAARLRVDTASQGLTGTQQSNARTNLGLGSMALLSSIDISDNTNLAAGTGIDLAGDTVSVDVSDFMSGGSNNRVLTAAGTDTFQGEANLTYDGTQLSAIGDTNDKDVLLIGNTAGNSGSTAGITHLGLSHWDSGTYPSTRITATEDAAGSYLGSLSFSTRGAASDSAATERMRILSDGKVGIGTTSPGSTLHLTSGSGYLKFDTSGSTGSIKSDFNLDLYADDTDGNSSGYQNIRFFPAGTEAMRVAHDGKVGIGTTSPEYELDLVGGLRVLPTIASHAGTAIRIGPQDNDIDVTLLRVDGNGGGAGTGNSGESNNSNYGYSIKYMGSGSGVNNRYALFMDNQAGTAFEAMTVLQDGKVGISDSTPSYHLDVAGDINLTGTLRQNGNAITTYNLYDNEITLSAGTGLTGGGAFTLNQNSDETLTFNVAGLTVSELAANSLQLSSESFADNDTSLMTSAAIQDKIESYGYSTTTGDITNVSAGVGLSGGGGSGSVTLTLDMSELPDMTQAVASSEDELIILDNGADKRKLISEIPLSAFNNDSSFITATYAGDFSAERLNLEKSSGYATIEMGGSSGAFIDMKNPFSDDFDARIISDGTGLDIIAAGAGNHVTLKTNNAQRLKVEDATTSLYNRLHADDGSVRAASLTFDAAASTILQSENSQLAFGLHNASPYPFWMQARTHTDGVRQLMINPLGGNVGIGALDADDAPLHVKHTGDGSTTVIFENTNASANEGPVIDLYRSSASPAVSDMIGTVKFTGINDNSEKVTYGEIQAFIEDETDATENAAFQFQLYEMGTPRENLRIGSTQITFNNTERNVDVLMKSDDGSTNFFSDASANTVGIGTTSPGKTLHVSDGSTSGISGGTNAALLITDDANPRIYFEDVGEGSGDRVMDIMYDSEYLSFNSLNDAASAYDTQNIMAIHRDGNVGIGSTSPDAKLRIHQTDGSVHGLKVSRNDSSTSTPLVFLLDDSVYVDSPTLHVRNDRADQYGYAALLEGRVGIGISGNMVTQPDQALHVEGSVLIDAYNNGKSTLDGAYSDGETSITLTDASTFNEKGTGTINGVEFSWTAKSGNVLTVPDLNANYADDVTVAADTGLFFREGHENDIQPSITIYDQSNSGVSRDDLSLNAYSAIRMQLNDTSELILTNDTLSLTPGNQDTGGFTFRGRSDLGMFESGYFCAIKAPESIFMMIDSNNNNTDKEFVIQKDGSGVGNGTEIFKITEAGAVTINQAFTFPTADGSANQILKTDGSGAVSWADDGGSGSSFAVGDITGATALTTGLASTDELVLSDAGTLKRMDVSVLQDYMEDKSSRVRMRDARADGDITPDGFNDARADFMFTDDIAGSPNGWDGVLTMAGWGDSYTAWQLMASNESDGGANASNNSLIFRTGEDATWGTLRKVITEDGGGQVGIGTGFNTDAANTLEIWHSAADGDNGIMIVNEATTISQNDVLGGIGFDSRDGNVPSSVLEASVGIVAKAREDHSTGDKGGYLDFFYAPTDQNDDTASRRGMRFMQGKLSVGGQNDDVGDPINSLVVEHAGSDWHNGILVLRDDASVADGDLLGAIGFDDKDGNNPSSVLEASAGIAAYAAEAHGTGDKGGDLAFFTSAINDDDDTASHERMRIDSEGNVGIGTAAPETILHLETSSGQIAQLGTGNSAYSMHFADDRAMFGHVGGFATVQGGSGGKAVRFCVNNGTFGSGEVARFDTSGNFGLGDTSPSFASGIGMEITHATQANLRVTDSSATASSDFAQSDNDLYIVNRKSSGDIKIRVNGSDELLTLDGGTERVTQAKTTFSGNVTTTSSTNYNLYFPLYWQRDNMGTSNIDMRLPVGGDASTNPNNFAMPRAGKIMGFTVHYYGGSISTSSAVTDTWRARVHSGGTMDSSTLDTVVAHDTLTQSVNANNLVKTVEFGSPLAFSANDSVGFRRNANASSTLHEVNAVMWILFDE